MNLKTKHFKNTPMLRVLSIITREYLSNQKYFPLTQICCLQKFISVTNYVISLFTQDCNWKFPCLHKLFYKKHPLYSLAEKTKRHSLFFRLPVQKTGRFLIIILFPLLPWQMQIFSFDIYFKDLKQGF